MRRVAPVLQREVPRAFADPDPSFVQGYTPVGLVSLNPATAFLRMASRYHQAAALKCGRRVANRSWVAFIDFPNAKGALLGQGVAFLARTPTGWRIWGTTVVSELPRVDLT